MTRRRVGSLAEKLRGLTPEERVELEERLLDLAFERAEPGAPVAVGGRLVVRTAVPEDYTGPLRLVLSWPESFGRHDSAPEEPARRVEAPPPRASAPEPEARVEVAAPPPRPPAPPPDPPVRVDPAPRGAVRPAKPFFFA